jgi:hypothetical protein
MECGVAQPIAERVQDLTIKLAISPFGHRVVFEGRQLVN